MKSIRGSDCDAVIRDTKCPKCGEFGIPAFMSGRYKGICSSCFEKEAIEAHHKRKENNAKV